MILPFGLTPLTAKYIGGAIGIVLAITAFMLWLNHRENAAVEADRAKAAAEIAPRQQRAGEAAQATAAAIQTKAEKENDEARKAAAGSDDPLKSGFDSLRSGKARSHPATR